MRNIFQSVSFFSRKFFERNCFFTTPGQEKKMIPVAKTGCGARETREIAGSDWTKVI